MLDDSRRQRLAIATGLALVVAAVFAPVLFFGQTFIGRDALVFALPSRDFLGEALRAARFPEWNDRYGFGRPFAGDPMHFVGYPPAWIAALFPGPFGVDLLAALHVLAGALGLAALSRRLGASALGAAFAGAVWASSGYLDAVVLNGITPALAWIPWVAWGADRVAAAVGDGASRTAILARALQLAAFAALQLMTGEPAHVLIAALLALAVTLGRAPRRLPALGWVTAAGALALPLAAATVLSALGLLAWTSRGEGFTTAVASTWSMHPLWLLQLVWPGLLGDPTTLDRNLTRLPELATYSDGIFLGAPVLLLAATARARGVRVLLAFSALFVLLALGAHTPAYEAFRTLFPPARMVRFPEKYVAGALMIWAALAGVGLGRVQREGPTRRLLVAAISTAGLLVLGAAALAASSSRLASDLAGQAAALVPPTAPSAALDIALGGGAAAAAVAVAFGAALALTRREVPRRALAVGAVAALPVLQLVVAALTFTNCAPRDLVAGTPLLLEPVLAQRTEGSLPPRVFRAELVGRTGLSTGAQWAVNVHQSALPNAASRFGVGTVASQTWDNAESAALQRFAQSGAMSMSLQRFSRLFGVEYVLGESELAGVTTFPVIAATDAGFALFAVPDRRPRAFVAPRWRWGTEADAFSALLDRSRLDAGEVTLVGAGAAPPAAARDGEPLSACEVRSSRPEIVDLRCDSRLGGYAVVLDELAPGWNATVDGVDAPIVRAEGFFRGVAVGSGPHAIRLLYRAPGLRTGAAIALASWALWGVAMLVLRRRLRRVPEAITPAASSAPCTSRSQDRAS
jgi:hypothetical protein